MCTHCGCSSEKASLSNPGHVHGHRVVNLTNDDKTMQMKHALLAGNDAIADANRQFFAGKNVACINIMGTPGAGKTQLLETMITTDALPEQDFAVLEGDQESANDAQRIIDAGGKAMQINTGEGCHLDAEMIRAGIDAIAPSDDSLLFVENVGNLVCPALFDIGESARIAMMAVTDGEDKPVKYPHMFSQCDAIIINKIDLLPYLDFDLDRVKHDISHLNPGCPVFLTSAKTGEGLESLANWLKEMSHDG